jgi:DNA-binding NarL/FixJ family response regulator
MSGLKSSPWHRDQGRHRLASGVTDEVMETQGKNNGYGLTDRELAVVSLVMEGLADEEIAEALGIRDNAVHEHLGNVLGKMGARSRTEVGVRAIKEGFIRPCRTSG